MNKFHVPVLLKESVEALGVKKNKKYIDATLGGGGHAGEIIKRGGIVLGIDQDKEALEYVKKNFKFQISNFKLILANGNFEDIDNIAKENGFEKVSGILFDLGVSTYQLTSSERGFSFNIAAELDMRMDPYRQRLTAKKIVNNWDQPSLKRIFKTYGEEPYAGPIAWEISKARKLKPIEETDELVAIIKKAMPPKYRYSREKHFATATFRALRMAVNDELKILESGLKQAAQILSPGARIVVISFHSLEDRIVKNFFKVQPQLEILTKKPVVASPKEIKNNHKARSAKLRAALKI